MIDLATCSLCSSGSKELFQHFVLHKYLDKIQLGNFEAVWGSTLDGVGSNDVRLILQMAAEAECRYRLGVSSGTRSSPPKRVAGESVVGPYSLKFLGSTLAGNERERIPLQRDARTSARFQPLFSFWTLPP
jgi:hypothetical protein